MATLTLPPRRDVASITYSEQTQHGFSQKSALDIYEQWASNSDCIFSIVEKEQRSLAAARESRAAVEPSAFQLVSTRIAANPDTPPFVRRLLPLLNPWVTGVFAAILVSASLIALADVNTRQATPIGLTLAFLSALVSWSLWFSFRAMK